MKNYNPTTPSRRHMKGYGFSGLTKIAPLKSKKYGFVKSTGRNSSGIITSYHRGGGVKRLFREIDFKQLKLDVPAKVFSIEYDPNRTSRIARVHYQDGFRAYILAPQDLKV